jgi:hypothetical protein
MNEQDGQKPSRNLAERAMSNRSHSRNVIQHRTNQVPLFEPACRAVGAKSPKVTCQTRRSTTAKPFRALA